MFANPLQTRRVIVVGYHTLTLYPGLNMFSVNLGNMADAQGYSLDELFPGLDKDGNPTPGLVPNSSSSTADYVSVWDPEANGGTGGYVATYYLFKTSRASDLNYKWVLSKDAAAPIRIKSGMCLWFYHRVAIGTDPLTFSVPGQVEYSQSGANVIIKPGLNMMGAPYASNCDLNDLGVDYWTARHTAGEAIANSSSSTADYVSIWDPLANEGAGGYVATYYLFKTSRASAQNYKWVLNKDTVAPAGFIKMGQGAWYYCMGTGFTMTLPYPYDL